MGGIPSETVVIKARQTGNETTSAFAPDAADALAARIREERPGVVFAPHVETASGIILPDEYLKAIADAAHDVGALFVLDCIASGAIWVDMAATGVDVLISAPQKGWSASPAAGLVMLGERALARLGETTSTSFAMDLRKWHDIMQAYVAGGHAYHSTMPTDALKVLRDRMVETRDFGFDLARERQWELGAKVRALLGRNGYKSVAAPGFEAPGVVVSYTKDPDIQTGKKFLAEGMQIAAGVPLMCDEPADFRTFRIGLFGLDKLKDVDGTVARLEAVLEKIAEG
jgi:aspartate aminotransferase-like enzyme